MSVTLHGSTGLIYLPGRTLTRLENGVVQVARSYACRTSSAASFRGLFDVGRTMPGESGITVKFNFTETDRGDGFTEFQVTGSGPDPSQPSTGQSALKTQEGRAVQTYPSGLVRVERTYVCPTADEARFRPVLVEGAILPFDDGTPAIDGLYIFPAPNEIRRDDGYTEFRVTAYGRTNTTGFIEKNYISDTIGYTVAQQDGPDIYAESAGFLPSYIQRVVLKDNEISNFAFSLNATSQPASIAMYFFEGTTQFRSAKSVYVPFDVWKNYMATGPSSSGLIYNNQKLLPVGISTFSDIPKSVLFNSYNISEETTSTNFGFFSEYVISYRSVVFAGFY